MSLRVARFPTLALALMLASPLVAETVTYRFEPPEVPTGQICSPRADDGALLARWENWDKLSLDGREASEVASDLRRLRDMDAATWYGTIDAAIVQMPGIDPNFGRDQAALERIQLMIAAGRLRELEGTGLVVDLLQQDHGDSPKIQLALSRMLRLGQGVARDTTRADDLLVAAAIGGNADAILEIVGLQVRGQDVPGWDVSPELSVAMAFGALVGKLDAGICHRVTRIAREYKNGDIVTRDMELAERWFRFAAELGDADAAWKVAELHLESDQLAKNNAILIGSLKRAVEGGAAVALVALGRVYETGALAPMDLASARALYERAADKNDRNGLLRLVQLLNAARKDDPTLETAYASALDRLLARDDAPPSAYQAKADAILASQGRWAGEAAAMEVLEQSAAKGDGIAQERLALMKMRHATGLQEFYNEADVLIYAIRELGLNDPATELFDSFMCRSPAAPQVEDAKLWEQIENAKGSKTVSFALAELQDLALRPDQAKLSMLQTQALYGRATALAQYVTYLDLADAPASQRQFWQVYAARIQGVDQARARILLEAHVTGLERAQAVDLLRRALAAGDLRAGLPLANVLLHPESGPDGLDRVPDAAARAEATALLEPLAKLGIGEAFDLLHLADPGRWPTHAAIYRDFAKDIEANGDFDALVFALPFLADTKAVADYERRAATVTACTYDEVIALTEVMGSIGNVEGFNRWSAISRALTEGDAWQMTLLGDMLRLYGDQTQFAEGFALYERAHDLGGRTATQRLLALVSQGGRREYDPRKAATYYVELLASARPEEMVKLVRRIEEEEPEIRELTFAQLSPKDVYFTAAEGGNPVAMREYARLLRASATSPSDVASAVEWMGRAARLDDAPAMLDYAEMLAFGAGVAPSRDEALVWLRKAADKGVPEANVLLQSLTLSVSQ